MRTSPHGASIGSIPIWGTPTESRIKQEGVTMTFDEKYKLALGHIVKERLNLNYIPQITEEYFNSASYDTCGNGTCDYDDPATFIVYWDVPEESNKKLNKYSFEINYDFADLLKEIIAKFDSLEE